MDPRDWTIDGNPGTDPALNFIGTADPNGLSIRTNGIEALRITPGRQLAPTNGRHTLSGRVGVGTATPIAQLHVEAPDQLGLLVQGPAQPGVGAGVQLNAVGIRNWEILSTGQTAAQGAGKLNIRNLSDASDVFTITGDHRIGIGTVNPDATLHVNGVARVNVLAIAAGADVSERFEVQTEEPIDAGTVMVIDDQNPGGLRISDCEYDRKVVGIVPGACGLQSALNVEGGTCGRSVAVAIAGRTYCKAEAIRHPISPGDFLTTSGVRGHATKVLDVQRATGAILGKAMTSLPGGSGFVLVFVNLQ